MFPGREAHYFGQERFIQAQEKGPLSDKRYRDGPGPESSAEPDRGNRPGDGGAPVGRSAGAHPAVPPGSPTS